MGVTLIQFQNVLCYQKEEPSSSQARPKVISVDVNGPYWAFIGQRPAHGTRGCVVWELMTRPNRCESPVLPPLAKVGRSRSNRKCVGKRKHRIRNQLTMCRVLSLGSMGWAANMGKRKRQAGWGIAGNDTTAKVPQRKCSVHVPLHFVEGNLPTARSARGGPRCSRHLDKSRNLNVIVRRKSRWLRVSCPTLRS